MRSFRLLPMIVALAGVGALLAGTAAAASAPRARKPITRKYFLKDTSVRFVTPSGDPVSNSTPPEVGDTLLVTVNLYPGTSAHHAKHWTGSGALYCVVTAVAPLAAPARCAGFLSFGSSALISISNQNLASNSPVSVYPITGGTGNYLGATGTLTTTSIRNSNNSNGVLTFTP